MKRNYKILHVDDNEHGRYVVGRQLRHAGFEVIEAATGEQALDRLRENPDLVLLDVQLPDINGFEVCRRIKKDPITASTIVVHLSANVVASRDKTHGLESGADAYLVEPIEAAELVATINALIRLRVAEERARNLAGELELKIKELERQREMREYFVSALTHDLRGPLTAARLSAQLISRHRESAQAPKELAARALRNIDQADAMIQNLLDANRIGAGEQLPIRIADCELDPILATVFEQLTMLHGNRFLQQGDRGVRGKWDGEALGRVVYNLCDNAVKYGDVHAMVTLTVTEKGEGVRIAVHNHGYAIPEGEQMAIFRPFHRISSTTGHHLGWGLGLSLVRSLVEAHGGYVELHSGKEGTTFVVALPGMARQTTH